MDEIQEEDRSYVSSLEQEWESTEVYQKTLAFQIAIMMMASKFELVATPLNRLGEDQVEKCQKIGLCAVLLTSDAQERDPKLIGKIANGEYDLVYLAPEKLLQPNQPFACLLKEVRNNKVVNKIGFLIIDECYLVEDWGEEFRTDYARLGTLREHLPRVPFGACTTTTTPEKHEKIRVGLGFNPYESIRILEKVNRPNLFYAVRIIEGSGMGEWDLNFPIPKNLTTEQIQDMPKTLIYIDHKKKASKIATVL
ncbi:hypothetical protein L211DRAFT_853654 [Terfezia boudieri ATCC MYA-4762]|uniref:Helicase ATP-binding domain-containing protein n=1 Tax=Terfezia boudieri ATCC MYA-4762 TaxID=1051890 RepID=A0A3N4L7T5_9PEZI|nr:hypothetical protein L211DRAFT_853654 [Terfezia boudieri ATCC MYA-4762]